MRGHRWLGSGAALVAAAALGCGGPADELEAFQMEAASEPITPATCAGSAEVCTVPAGAVDTARSTCYIALGTATARWEVAQTFTMAQTGYASEARLLLKLLQPVPVGTTPVLKLDLRPATDASGIAKIPLKHPAGWPSMSIPASTLGPAGTEQELSVAITPQRRLAAGEKYALVLYVPYPDTMAVGVGCQREADPYAAGTAWVRQLQTSGGVTQALSFQPVASDMSLSLRAPDCKTGTIPASYACVPPYDLGSLSAGTTVTANGFQGDPYFSNWFKVTFPKSADFQDHGAGLPKIRFSPDPGTAPPATFPWRFELREGACPGGPGAGNCAPAGATGLTQWDFNDGNCPQENRPRNSASCSHPRNATNPTSTYAVCTGGNASGSLAACTWKACVCNGNPPNNTVGNCTFTDSCATRNISWPESAIYLRVYKTSNWDYCERYTLQVSR